MTNSDQTAVPTEAAAQEELDLLKERATLMNIQFHPSIGLVKLRDKVEAKIKATPSVDPAPVVTSVAETAPPVVEKSPEQLEREKMMRMRKEQSTLIRVIVDCRNPEKKEWPGEIFTAGSTMVGSHKKYVPFNNPEGWHVPKIILTMMQERKCQLHYDARDDRGRKIKKSRLIPEFAIEILPPLTQAELDDLAKKQAMANNLD